MLTRLLVAALAVAPAGSVASVAAQLVARPCLRYGPDTVQLAGRLERRTFYGPPGYGEDPRRDARETGFYLALAAPVCTVAGRDAEFDDAKSGVRLVQLVLDAAGYRRLRPSVGRVVTLRGTLFGAHTGHHHAPLLLEVTPPRAEARAPDAAPAARPPGA